MLFTTYLYVLSMSSLCASAYIPVNCTLFTQLPVVDVRRYKGGAAEIFRFPSGAKPNSYDTFFLESQGLVQSSLSQSLRGTVVCQIETFFKSFVTLSCLLIVNTRALRDLISRVDQEILDLLGNFLLPKFFLLPLVQSDNHLEEIKGIHRFVVP